MLTEKKIIELEALRGFCSLWVLLFHILTITGLYHLKPFSVLGEFKNGKYAVDIFIILSGFMISFLLTAKKESYREYITRRFLRLWPVYMFCILIAFSLNKTGVMPVSYDSSTSLVHLAIHTTMLHGLVPASVLFNAGGSILNPAWSISLEWQFYLLAPVVLTFMRRFKGRGVWMTALASIILMKVSGHFGSWDNAFLPAKLGLFAIGMLSHHLFQFALKNTESLKGVALYFLPTVLVIFVCNFSFHSVWPLFIWALVLFSLIGHQVDSQLLLPKVITKCLQQPSLIWIGKVSYSLYLIHEIVIYTLLSGMKSFGPSLTSTAFFAIVCILSISISLLLSSLLYQYIEKPFVKLGKRITKASYMPVSREAVSKEPALPAQV